MIPTLFEIGPFRVHAYGVMLAVSFLVGSLWARRAGARRGIHPDLILSLVGWILVSAIVGARLHFVLAHPDSYEDPLGLLRIWEGGLTLYGGLIAAIVVSFLYLRRNRIEFLPVADAVAPALALGEAVTRVGCFLNGCCFGAPCDGPLCIHYPSGSYSSHAVGDVPIYPSQLILSAAMLLLFLLLWRLDRKKIETGRLFAIYLAGQGIIRYGVDFTRYYEPVDRVGFAGPILVAKSQIVALFLAALGVALLVARAGARGQGRGS